MLGVLKPGIQGVSVGDVFEVKQGTTKRGCDERNIDGWFADTFTLENPASTGVAAVDPDSRKYLETFLSFDPRGDATEAGGPIGQQKWDDIAFDEATGLPCTDQKKVEDIFSEDTTGLVPSWFDDIQQYLKADSGDYCPNKDNLEATQDQTAPSTVTLCIDNFSSAQGGTLANVPSVTKEKISVSTLQVDSLTLFHEMFHLVLGTADTPDHSYSLNPIVGLGAAKAVQNPESSTFYALAYYLGQNTQFTNPDVRVLAIFQ
ncbi:hypothetical protein F4823DRAFT_631002 [Ustulina deusta]|nr:hypothetical protein F4823DRAFT_631002 [Ustulina deusta]